ncbi:MAG: pyridoxamine 5'-phosphate oxidase [Myxococcales bacterium]|nr:pyridoxamine 5'-phosphate oxidase [Myxococcales bacterium]
MSDARPADLASLRAEYTRSGLSEADLDPDPFRQLQRWLDDAVRAGVNDATAMTLATVGGDGAPSARIVLLKGLDRGLVFYTNYESHKARELAKNPRAAVVLFWPDLERQVRVTGGVEKLSRSESEAYFTSRPRESQLGAWASIQSESVVSREALDARFEEAKATYDGRAVPCPPHWGGFRLVPDSFEMWQGRVGRMHDRLRYRPSSPVWTVERLMP